MIPLNGIPGEGSARRHGYINAITLADMGTNVNDSAHW